MAPFFLDHPVYYIPLNVLLFCSVLFYTVHGCMVCDIIFFFCGRHVQRTVVTIVLEALLALIGFIGGGFCLAVTILFCKVTCCARYNYTNVRLNLTRHCSSAFCRNFTGAASIKQIGLEQLSAVIFKSRFSRQCENVYTSFVLNVRSKNAHINCSPNRSRAHQANGFLLTTLRLHSLHKQ